WLGQGALVPRDQIMCAERAAADHSTSDAHPARVSGGHYDHGISDRALNTSPASAEESTTQLVATSRVNVTVAEPATAALDTAKVAPLTPGLPESSWVTNVAVPVIVLLLRSAPIGTAVVGVAPRVRTP